MVKHEILGHQFEMDELADIANHGMAAGVSGFIYSSELHDIFEEHEETIFNLLDEYALDLGEKSGMQLIIDAITGKDDSVYYTMQCIKEMAVWMYVELRAVDLLQSSGHPDWT